MPPETTTESATTKRYNVSAVLHSSSGNSAEFYNGSWREYPSLNDGFAAYSTALSVTVAIGCSLLILNILIFAGVYYQRDKTKMEARKVTENGSLLAPAHSISGDLGIENQSNRNNFAANSGKIGFKNSQNASLQTHLPPPEFADQPCKGPYDSSGHLATLPRGGIRPVGPPGTALTLTVPRAPPPPRVPTSHVSEVQPLLQSQAQQVLQQSSNFNAGSPDSARTTVIKENEMCELRV